MIPRHKIDEIVDAAHIEDVVGGYVNLKKRGANLTGLCPFHQEKTPSFSVSPSKGIYKCFGCGKAGNSVNFIMDVEQLGYIDALKHLAEKYNIEWPVIEISAEKLAEEKRNASIKESLQIVNNFTEGYFNNLLNNDDEGKTIGLSYFEERGYRPETIEKFKLGYAKNSWDHLSEHAQNSGFNIDLLVIGGLVKRNDESGKMYDAYRNRVIFPIHSISGKPIAFAGRYLVKDVKSPKYVNSPETPLYHKSNELYGLYFAKQAITKQGLVYLVEGYTDVITLHQAGIENVVASSGTSLTDGQIKLLKRFTDNVCVLYDGDAAGIKASLRGVDMLLEAGLNVKIVLFPDGEDPDSYCQKQGSVGFSNFLDENKQDFILFKTNLLLGDAGNDPLKKAELIRDIVESISKIPDVFKRSTFLHETATLLKVDEQLLISEANRLVRNKVREQPKTPSTTLLPENQEAEQIVEAVEDLRHQDAQEKDLIRVLLTYGEKNYDESHPSVALYLVNQIFNEEIEIQHPLVGQIIKEVHEQLVQNQLQVNYFLRHSDPVISAFVADLMAKDFELSPNWAKKHDVYMEPLGSNYKADADSALLRLKIKFIEKLMEENQKELEQQVDLEQQNLHVNIHMHLAEKRFELTQKVETTITR